MPVENIDVAITMTVRTWLRGDDAHLISLLTMDELRETYEHIHAYKQNASNSYDYRIARSAMADLQIYLCSLDDKDILGILC